MLKPKLTTILGRGFEFDERAHYYYLNGKKLTGVTTVLATIAKPALIQWAADEAVKPLGWYDNKYDDGFGADRLRLRLDQFKQMQPYEFKAYLDDARSMHRKKKEAAGDTGTLAHDWIERFVKGRIKGLPDLPYEPETEHITQNFVTWANQHQVTFLESEKRLYSEPLWLAGTVDLVFIKDGQKFIGDIKTGNAIYPEHFFQCAAYRMMLEDMGATDFAGACILLCTKAGKFETAERFDNQTDRQAFMGALALYRAIETFK